MKILFGFFFFSFSATAVVPQMSCERAKAVRSAASELLQEQGVSVEEAELSVYEQGVPELSEELADLLSDCSIESSPMAGLLDELEEGYGKQEKSCKTALDDYSKSETMTAALPASIAIGVMLITVTGCLDSDSGSRSDRRRSGQEDRRQRPSGK